MVTCYTWEYYKSGLDIQSTHSAGFNGNHRRTIEFSFSLHSLSYEESYSFECSLLPYVRFIISFSHIDPVSYSGVLGRNPYLSAGMGTV